MTDLPKISIVSGPGGYCPVQGDAIVEWPDGRVDYGYFRARGDLWTVGVWENTHAPAFELPDRDPDWEWAEAFGTRYDAGWMESDPAIQRFLTALALYIGTKAVRG
ncbi:MAG: hypothetical protein ABL912_01645 [Novosphingobium sp.]